MLNFDAYSFPDVGGWIVIGAAMLAFGVWFAEWYHHRKLKNKSANTAPVAVALMSFLWISCSTKPEPFNYGKDVCYTCKMGIIDARFGGEVITSKGKIYKFDDLICMGRYLRSGVLAEKEIKQTVSINFEKQNDFIDVNKAFFLISPELKSPMGSNAAAFNTKEAAQKLNTAGSGIIIKWQEFYDRIK